MLVKAQLPAYFLFFHFFSKEMAKNSADFRNTHEVSLTITSNSYDFGNRFEV